MKINYRRPSAQLWSG